MFCTNCGNKLDDGVKFCPSCGTRVEVPAPVVETPAPVVEEPVVETPAPVVEEPVVETPAPVVEEPVVETPAPVVEEPVVETPAPVAEEPVVEIPAPVVEAPVAAEPPIVPVPNAIDEPFTPVIPAPLTIEPTPVTPVQPAKAPAKGSSTGALVLGILSFVFSWTGLIGLILGIIGIAKANKFAMLNGSLDGKARTGKIFAIIGVVFSAIMTLVWIIVIGAAIFYAINAVTYRGGWGDEIYFIN